jgi:hypothetical protein
MDGFCYQFLACSALSLDENGNIRLGDLINDRLKFAHLGIAGKKDVGKVLHAYVLMSNPNANVGIKILSPCNPLKTI